MNRTRRWTLYPHLEMVAMHTDAGQSWQMYVCERQAETQLVTSIVRTDCATDTRRCPHQILSFHNCCIQTMVGQEHHSKGKKDMSDVFRISLSQTETEELRVLVTDALRAKYPNFDDATLNDIFETQKNVYVEYLDTKFNHVAG